jgi:hypothetical protein
MTNTYMPRYDGSIVVSNGVFERQRTLPDRISNILSKILIASLQSAGPRAKTFPSVL